MSTPRAKLPKKTAKPIETEGETTPSVEDPAEFADCSDEHGDQ